MIELSDFQKRILEGLAPGNTHAISAAEMPEFGFLTEHGLVEAWKALPAGVVVWRITLKGKKIWEDLSNKDALPEVM